MAYAYQANEVILLMEFIVSALCHYFGVKLKIVGASMSEPHTSVLNRNLCVCVCVSVCIVRSGTCSN